jgi:hypothetical protein
MPLTLHPHLKRGLDSNDFYINAEDILEDVPRKFSEPEDQVAKRLRIEKIASQYLQGKLPVLLSAGLRGPFNNGWKNPWVTVKKTKRRVSDKENGASRKAVVNGRNAARRTESADVKKRTRGAARKTLAQQGIASPETSRAINDDLENFQETYTLTELEAPPATAPLAEEHDTLGGTNLFSVETERCIQSRSPLTDPFWLRRPESRGNLDINSTNGTTEVSPTHSRGILPQLESRRTPQLAIPRALIGLRAPPVKVALKGDITSSASASMVLSSPVKLVDPIESGTARLTDSQEQIHKNAPIQIPNLSSEMQPAQVWSNPASMTKSTCATAHENTTASPVALLKDSRPVMTHHESTSPQGSHAWPSPAPKSSSGFEYKKVGGKKWTIGNAPRSKPRAFNFNSSQANQKNVSIVSKSSSQKTGTAAEAVASEASSAPTTVPSQPKESGGRNQHTGSVGDQQSLRSSRSSNISAMSTQAAMLLAQQEFLERTYPTSSSETPRPWSQLEEETSQSILPEPSPAITPLSMFQPQLGQSHPLTSVLHDPLVSTQDLFAAASPFAFSTTKKKPNMPQRSNLQMATMSFDGQDESVLDVSLRRPMLYADRIALEEKNSVPSPWSFSFGKGPRTSQGSLQGGSRGLISDVEIPQPDFRTSPDDYGCSDSLHFTDRLLRN